MSGGSFDYLYSRAPDELRSISSELGRMADVCGARAAEGGALKDWETGAPLDVAALAEAGDFLRMLSMRVGGMARALEHVADLPRAVEWWKSCDSGADDVIKTWLRLKEKAK